MKDFFVSGSIHVIEEKFSPESIKKFSETFGCPLRLVKEDGDGKYYMGEVLGFDVSVSATWVPITSEALYNVGFSPNGTSMPKNLKDSVSLDFHLKYLLEGANFGRVLTADEYGTYMDELGVE